MGLSVMERADAVRVVAAGMSCKRVAADLAVPPSTVLYWANTAGMEFQSRAKHGTVWSSPLITRMDTLKTPGGRLTLLGRSWIETRLRQGQTRSAIAAELGVHPSTITREINQRVNTAGKYFALPAHGKAVAATARPKPRKLDGDELRRRVVAWLKDGRSPQQIQGRLRREFPDREDLRVSHETIYQALYVQGAGTLRHELTVEQALRSGRSTRKPRSKLPARSNRSWIGNGTRITDRPPAAADRAIPGHWEGDLMLGGVGKGALITLVERRSRFMLLGLLPESHDSFTVSDELTAMISTLPTTLRGTLTWDQGAEMALHADLTLATDLRVFFCDPHSPWQRPTNENHNGLLRQYFPKGTDFRNVTREEVSEAQRRLNTRPRAVLDFATPAEKINEQLTIALTP